MSCCKGRKETGAGKKKYRKRETQTKSCIVRANKQTAGHIDRGRQTRGRDRQTNKHKTFSVTRTQEQTEEDNREV